MSHRVGQLPARTWLSALLIALAVGVLPASSLLHHPLAQSPTVSLLQTAAPMHSDSQSIEDPVEGPVWAPAAELQALLPPTTDPAWPRPNLLRRAGHPRRIDRPPTA